MELKDRNPKYDDDGRLIEFDCNCGARIEVYDCMTNSCDDCPKEYNGSGQLLADRSQWGEETGEHPSDLGRSSYYSERDPEEVY